jgi:hypothetical protein
MFEDGGRGSLPGSARGRRLHWWLACVATLLAQYPLLRALPALFGRDAVLLGDGWWRAIAARSMAQGLPHGWIDATDGGFTVGPYYPVGGWLLVSSLIRLGCDAKTAVQVLGVAGTLAIPFVFYSSLEQSARARRRRSPAPSFSHGFRRTRISSRAACRSSSAGSFRKRCKRRSFCSGFIRSSARIKPDRFPPWQR